jgi:hypothetical protein
MLIKMKAIALNILSLPPGKYIPCDKVKRWYSRLAVVWRKSLRMQTDCREIRVTLNP